MYLSVSVAGYSKVDKDPLSNDDYDEWMYYAKQINTILLNYECILTYIRESFQFSIIMKHNYNGVYTVHCIVHRIVRNCMFHARSIKQF